MNTADRLKRLAVQATAAAADNTAHRRRGAHPPPPVTNPDTIDWDQLIANLKTHLEN